MFPAVLRSLVRALARPRPLELSVFAVAAFLALPYNGVFWAALAAAATPLGAGDLLFLLATFLLLTAVHALLLLLVAWRRLFKPLATLLFLVSAAVACFMSQYGVVIDADMIASALATDWREVRDLLTPRLLLFLLLLGALPAWLLWRLPIAERSWRQALWQRAGALLLAILAVVALLWATYHELAPIARNNPKLRFTLTPLNYVWGLARHVSRQSGGAGPLQVVAADAHRVEEAAGRRRPLLAVIVVGETARADHFTLNGYPRDTTPGLRALAAADHRLINLPNVWSCGTATAVSLPCMFSNLGREAFSESRARQRENLLDVLQRAGLAVLWIDNNAGCKGNCDRVPTLQVGSDPANPECAAGECPDDVLVDRLAAVLPDINRDTVVVLHQMGSHGPAYHKRHPAAFARFLPECTSSQLDRCPPEAVVNAYDNTIAYTDHVLSRLLRLLGERAPQLDSMALYMSDHGESLGEFGLYLHGMPYAFAPDAQKHVPAVLWLSEGYASRFDVDSACLARRAGERYSHDWLFHTMLGALGVETAARDPRLDFLAGCRPQRA